MTDLLNKLLRHAEYSFRDIDFDWDLLTPAEKTIRFASFSPSSAK